jgi:hypothetical protein
MMRLLLMLLAALAFVACDETGTDRPRGVGAVFVPTSTAGATIAPSTLTLLPASTCAVGPGISTAFDLNVVPPDTHRSNVDHVTFHLIDGSNLGGPMVTIPRPELDRRFGSTALAGPRTFAFQPLFDCGFVGARFLIADVVIITDRGATFTMSARAAVR